VAAASINNKLNVLKFYSYFLLTIISYFLFTNYYYSYFLLIVLLIFSPITLTSYLLFINTIYYLLFFLNYHENRSGSQIWCPVRTWVVLTQWELDWKLTLVFSRRVRTAQHCYNPNMTWYKHDMLMLSRLWTWLNCKIWENFR
jgi:hypothetical protein